MRISTDLRALLNQIAALFFPILLGVYLLVTSTTHLSDTLWQYDAKRMLQLYLLAALLLWVLVMPGLRSAFIRQVQRIPQWMTLALGLMFTLGVTSAWFNRAPGLGLAYSLTDVVLLFLLITSALAIAACRDVAGEWFDATIIVLLAMLGVAVGLQELIGVLAAWNSGLEFNFESALVYFAFPRFFNQVQSWTIPVLAALPLLFPRHRLAVVLCIVALSLNWFVVIETGGRGTAVGLSFALILVTLLIPASRRKLLPVQLASLLAGAILFTTIVYLHAQREEMNSPEAHDSNSVVLTEPGKNPRSGSDNGTNDGFASAVTGKRMATSSGRIPMWKGCLNNAKQNPWLGIGPMNYACKGPFMRPAHPHNFPLQFLAEWGIPATVLLFIVGSYLAFGLLAAMKTVVRTALPSGYLAVALGTGIIAAAIHACFSGVLIMPASQVTGILIVGWFLGSLPGFAMPSVSRGRAMTLLVLSIALSGLLVGFAQTQVSSNTERYNAMAHPGNLLPRFWQFGKDCREDFHTQPETVR